MRVHGTALLIVGALCVGPEPAGAVAIAKGRLEVVAVPPATPLTDPSGWVTTDDYPAKALHDMVEGVTGASLAVDAAGFVSNCTIATSSGSPLLDQTACSLLTARARFRPGRPDGPPGHWSQRVRWTIPRPPAVELRPMRFTVQYDVDETGRPANCVAQGTTPGGASPDQACIELQKQVTFKVAAGQDGRPVRRRVIQTFSVQVSEMPVAPATAPTHKQDATRP